MQIPIYRTAVLAAILLCSACNQPDQILTAEFFAMGEVPVHITGYQVKRKLFFDTVDSYRLKVQLLESQVSAFRKNSLLSRAARSNASPVELTREVEELLIEAIAYSRFSRGAFDPTVLPLIKLWKHASRQGRAPTSTDLELALQHVGIEHIHIQHTDSKTLLSLDPGTGLDLGGVAKGYFADVGIRLMQQAGISRGLVELGGDLVAYDHSDNPKPFWIGIRHPRDKDTLLGKMQINSGAIVTSGDYERYLQIGNKRYSHIIDPRIGMPTEQICAVTLTAPKGSQADALATAVMVLGEKEGLKLANRIPGIEVLMVFVLPDGGLRVVASPNMKRRFKRKRL